MNSKSSFHVWFACNVGEGSGNVIHRGSQAVRKHEVGY